MESQIVWPHPQNCFQIADSLAVLAHLTPPLTLSPVCMYIVYTVYIELKKMALCVKKTTCEHRQGVHISVSEYTQVVKGPANQKEHVSTLTHIHHNENNLQYVYTQL